MRLVVRGMNRPLIYIVVFTGNNEPATAGAIISDELLVLQTISSVELHVILLIVVLPYCSKDDNV